MKTFSVILPVATSVNVAVEAETAEKAIEKAMELDLRFSVTGEGQPELGEELVMPKVITQGNYFFGPVNEASAEEEE